MASGPDSHDHTDAMSPSTMILIRKVARIATLIAFLGAVALFVNHDWPDAVPVSCFGILTLTSARKMTWELRHYEYASRSAEGR